MNIAVAPKLPIGTDSNAATISVHLTVGIWYKFWGYVLRSKMTGLYVIPFV